MAFGEIARATSARTPAIQFRTATRKMDFLVPTE